MFNYNPTSTPEKKFHYEFKWNFLGSLFYESIKVLHQIILMYVLSPVIYGVIGSCLSIIYFSTKLVDSGASYTLTPFFKTLTDNKNNFLYIIKCYFITPLIPMIPLISCGALWYYSYLSTSFSLLHIITIPFLIALETIRGFLRYILHFSYKSKHIVPLEMCSFSLYVFSIWFGFLTSLWDVSLSTVLIAHTVESLIVTCFFVKITYTIYTHLPQTSTLTIAQGTSLRFWRARLFNWFLRLSRELFSSNFITPLCALQFGFIPTSVFYCIGVVMGSLQAIIKVSIGYSGNTLLAHTKHRTSHEKQQAFLLLSTKVVKVLTPFIILLIINSGPIVSYCTYPYNGIDIVILSVIVIILFISEFFVVLYDQFYIVEESSHSLFFIKIAEYFAYYISVIAYQGTTLTDTLIRITGIRIISLAVMAYHAYYTWQIKPHFYSKKSYLLSCFILAFAIFFTVSHTFPSLNSIFHFAYPLL